MKWPRRPVVTPNRDPAASMALLNEVLDRPVDPGYHTAAANRRAVGLVGSTSQRSPVLIVTVILLGFLLSLAALSLRTPDPQDGQERMDLAERVEAAGTRGDGSALTIEGLREEIADLQAQVPAAGGGELTDELEAVAAAAGAVPVAGPGVLITMDDAPVDDLAPAPEPGYDADRVLAGDLSRLVNALWEGGAEAISINDQRLTVTSSIRFAGEAIIVDFRGLTRPYVVRAIGDPQVMVDVIAKGDTGQYFADLRDEYGIVVEWERSEQLSAPAAERLTTRVAVVKEEDDS